MIVGVPVNTKDIFATWINPHGLAISPDGAWVGMLYARAGRYRLGFFAVAGDQCPREIELTCGRPGGLTWSPSGDTVAFFAGHRGSLGANVFVLDLESGDISQTGRLMAECLHFTHTVFRVHLKCLHEFSWLRCRRGR